MQLKTIESLLRGHIYILLGVSVLLIIIVDHQMMLITIGDHQLTVLKNEFFFLSIFHSEIFQTFDIFQGRLRVNDSF